MSSERPLHCSLVQMEVQSKKQKVPCNKVSKMMFAHVGKIQQTYFSLLDVFGQLCPGGLVPPPSESESDVQHVISSAAAWLSSRSCLWV